MFRPLPAWLAGAGGVVAIVLVILLVVVLKILQSCCPGSLPQKSRKLGLPALVDAAPGALGQAHHLLCASGAAAAACRVCCASAAGCAAAPGRSSKCCEDLEEVKDEAVKPPEAFDNLAMDKERPRVGPLSEVEASGTKIVSAPSLVGRGCLETGGEPHSPRSGSLLVLPPFQGIPSPLRNDIHPSSHSLGPVYQAHTVVPSQPPLPGPSRLGKAQSGTERELVKPGRRDDRNFPSTQLGWSIEAFYPLTILFQRKSPKGGI